MIRTGWRFTRAWTTKASTPASSTSTTSFRRSTREFIYKHLCFEKFSLSNILSSLLDFQDDNACNRAYLTLARRTSTPCAPSCPSWRGSSSTRCPTCAARCSPYSRPRSAREDTSRTMSNYPQFRAQGGESGDLIAVKKCPKKGPKMGLKNGPRRSSYVKYDNESFLLLCLLQFWPLWNTV